MISSKSLPACVLHLQIACCCCCCCWWLAGLINSIPFVYGKISSTNSRATCDFIIYEKYEYCLGIIQLHFKSIDIRSYNWSIYGRAILHQRNHGTYSLFPQHIQRYTMFPKCDSTHYVIKQTTRRTFSRKNEFSAILSEECVYLCSHNLLSVYWSQASYTFNARWYQKATPTCLLCYSLRRWWSEQGGIDVFIWIALFLPSMMMMMSSDTRNQIISIHFWKIPFDSYSRLHERPPDLCFSTITRLYHTWNISLFIAVIIQLILRSIGIFSSKHWLVIWTSEWKVFFLWLSLILGILQSSAVLQSYIEIIRVTPECIKIISKEHLFFGFHI